MEKLILHPTDTCQWHALVYEAEVATNLILTEATESYLVFLLMRFSQRPHLLESVVALDYLESMQMVGAKKAECLQAVGDKSLLFCGLFPGMAKKRHVSIHYFSDIGKSAYRTLDALNDKKDNDLYFQLSAQFSSLEGVLQGMRGQYSGLFK